MFNIVSKSWSLSFSGGSIAIAPPSLNFCMQPCIYIVCIHVHVYVVLVTTLLSVILYVCVLFVIIFYHLSAAYCHRY